MSGLLSFKCPREIKEWKLFPTISLRTCGEEGLVMFVSELRMRETTAREFREQMVKCLQILGTIEQLTKPSPLGPKAGPELRPVSIQPTEMVSSNRSLIISHSQRVNSPLRSVCCKKRLSNIFTQNSLCESKKSFHYRKNLIKFTWVTKYRYLLPLNLRVFLGAEYIQVIHTPVLPTCSF